MGEGADREKPEERRAGDYVAMNLSAELRLHDFPPRQRAHDYDLLQGNNVDAMEVVRFTNQDRTTHIRRWAKYASEGLAVAGLSRSWHLAVESSAPFRDLARELARPLQLLESASIDKVFVSHDRWSRFEPLRSAAILLEQLGVRSASSFAPTPQIPAGVVNVGVAGGATIGLGTEPPLRSMEAFLGGDLTGDVREKLAKSGRARRHVFVWLDLQTDDQAWWLLDCADFCLPMRAPVLPDEITEVWWTRGGRGWHWDSVAGWQALAPVRNLLDAFPTQSTPRCACAAD